MAVSRSRPRLVLRKELGFRYTRVGMRDSVATVGIVWEADDVMTELRLMDLPFDNVKVGVDLPKRAIWDGVWLRDHTCGLVTMLMSRHMQ